MQRIVLGLVTNQPTLIPVAANFVVNYLKFMGVMLILVVILGIGVRIARAVKVEQIYLRIKSKGLAEVHIREINKQQVDDTLSNAALGYWLAGNLGMFVGAASGRQKEKVTSITFWIRYRDGGKERMTLPPTNYLARKLIKHIEDNDYDAW